MKYNNCAKGKYKVKYPKKYKGDASNVTYRSSWELGCMVYFDTNPDIMWWGSEEIVIPYRSPIDGKLHRYFPDFIVKTSKSDTIVFEVKPAIQSRPPKKRARITKKYLNEVKTWGINQAKWDAAVEYCADRQWKFQVITEDHLFKKNNK
jgi:hypothetical protein